MNQYQVFYTNKLGDFTSRVVHEQTAIKALSEFVNNYGGFIEVLGLIKI